MSRAVVFYHRTSLVCGALQDLSPCVVLFHMWSYAHACVIQVVSMLKMIET